MPENRRRVYLFGNLPRACDHLRMGKHTILDVTRDDSGEHHVSLCEDAVDGMVHACLSAVQDFLGVELIRLHD